MTVTVLVLVTVSVSGGGAEPARTEYTYDEPAVCEVGRAPACSIRIGAGHGSVSGRHCRLEIDPPGVRLRDLGSRYGTYVNGRRLGRLEEHRVADGDEIRIGDVRLRVRTAQRPAPGGEPGAAVGAARCLLPDPPAAVLADYELLRELGRGSQGVVHLARHLGTGQLVALKQFLVSGTVDETARFALHRELESIRALDHPHIVSFRGSAHLDEQFWFACEYCPAAAWSGWPPGTGAGCRPGWRSRSRTRCWPRSRTRTKYRCPGRAGATARPPRRTDSYTGT
ncbi:serine/threonine-protein kinase [Streptomyces sp. MS1.HAVA.3]|uniref:non-specific serine/threonine protein kinase n=1 Tax=Streptomyces caledonius TaxID=3134107 RepID=A0ABU8U2M1_9ACTN